MDKSAGLPPALQSILQRLAPKTARTFLRSLAYKATEAPGELVLRWWRKRKGPKLPTSLGQKIREGNFGVKRLYAERHTEPVRRFMGRRKRLRKLWHRVPPVGRTMLGRSWMYASGALPLEYALARGDRKQRSKHALNEAANSAAYGLAAGALFHRLKRIKNPRWYIKGLKFLL